MKSVSEILGNTKSIPGFHVMEWLRGVRDANYELSIKARKRQKEGKRMEEKAQTKVL